MYFGYFYVLRSFFKAGPANWLYEDKAIVVVGVLEIALFYALFTFLVVVTPLELSVSDSSFLLQGIFGIILVMFNFSYFGNKSRLAEFSAYFRSISAREKRTWYVSVALVTLLAIGMVIVLFWLAMQAKEM